MVERKWLDDNLNLFLYGTEYPDNSNASYRNTRGYDDSTKHHNYYDSSGFVTDASAATRAREEYGKALTELRAGRNDTAAIYAGSMTHYIADVAVFSHVLTQKNDRNHEAYEEYVRTRTTSYNYGVLESYLVFDDKLENISAYGASISLGRNTFNDNGGIYTARWMDATYDWSNPAFRNRCGESLNLTTNYVADVLHALALAAFGTAMTKLSSQITCTASPTSISIGSTITVSGFVSPAVPDKVVTLTYRKPDSSTLTRTLTSRSDGSYSDSYKPDATGSWNVTASWSGDSSHKDASSLSASFTVSEGAQEFPMFVVFSSIFAVLLLFLLILVRRGDAKIIFGATKY
jgi:hypothetical protein